jgi:hypothetical protein
MAATEPAAPAGEQNPRLTALGATMAADEIDFAGQHSPGLSSGAELPAPERSARELPASGLPGPDTP